MGESVELGRKEVGLYRKGGNCPESKQIVLRKCKEERLVKRAAEMLKKCEYMHKIGRYLYIIQYKRHILDCTKKYLLQYKNY
jgi:hypothetical protein